MLDFIKRFIKSEIFAYLFVGFLTTVVNIVSFQLLLKAFAVTNKTNLTWKLAEILAFVIAVIFAFITNKLFVFKSHDMSFSVIAKESGGFLVGRLVTEVINFFMMWYMIDKKGCNELFTKICASIVVIVLNYIFSKFIIFKKKVNDN